MISPIKLSISTKIPSQSSGRLLDALTDVIRPLTERMGLKADLIRLQREEVALKVAILAAERVKRENKAITPIPLKTVTRLLESASLEEPGDETMINLWANLLASSAIAAENNVPRFVSILSDLNGQQAQLIQDIFTKQGKIKTCMDADLLSDDLWGMDEAGVMLTLKQNIKRVTPSSIRKIVKDHLDMPGVAIADIIINSDDDQWDSPVGLFPVDKRHRDFDILESLNLLSDRSFKYKAFQGYELSVPFYCVSQLCVDMFTACNPKIMKRRENGEPVAGSYQLAKRSGKKSARQN